jgi:prophage DNA circulation protein
MVWQKQLRTASFRKIRFTLTNAESSFGRRTVSHQFPKRDEPYSEDMGRKAREFQIEAFVLGPDYLRQRDRLIKACETPGPGRLIHPYYGKKDVVCTGCEIRENPNEGGVARFQLSFKEAGKLRFPQVKTQPKGIFALLGAESLDASIQSFTDTFSVAEQPAFVVESAQDKVDEFIEALDTSTAFISRNSDEIADLAFAITDLGNDVEQIVHTPEVLAFRITSSLELLRSALSNRLESVKALISFFGFGSSDVYSSRTTTSRLAQKSNSKSFNSFIGQAAIAYGALDLPEISYSSIDEAKFYRDKFINEINSQQESDNITDDVFQALQQLKYAIYKSVPPEDENLSSVVSIVPTITTDILNLTYDLYGTLDKEEDVQARNNFRNPGFIMGGEPVKVLSNG